MNRSRLLGLIAVTLGVWAGVVSSASATHNPAKPIHPGVMTYTAGAQCTSNFIFRDSGGTYIGQAAHCSGTGGSTETNGCDSGSLPIGTAVEVGGATRPGTLVYNSWLTMQAAGESDPDTCQYNDFALVKLDPADAGLVDPSIPGWGGPTSLGSSAAMLGDTVYSYGNSSLRQGITKLGPKQGVVVQGEGNGWSRTVYTLTPGVPGDSGSAFLGTNGEAIGVLSTLQLAPVAGSNGVADLRKALDYMHSHSSFTGTQLVPGTAPFDGNFINAILNS